LIIAAAFIANSYEFYATHRGWPIRRTFADWATGTIFAIPIVVGILWYHVKVDRRRADAVAILARDGRAGLDEDRVPVGSVRCRGHVKSSHGVNAHAVRIRGADMPSQG
jgi:hypothetical protein